MAGGHRDSFRDGSMGGIFAGCLLFDVEDLGVVFGLVNAHLRALRQRISLPVSGPIRCHALVHGTFYSRLSGSFSLFFPLLYFSFAVFLVHALY